MHHAHSFFPLDLVDQVGESTELIWVVDTSSVNPVTNKLLQRLGRVVDTAGLDLDRTASVLADLRPDGIVSFVDDHIETAAALAARLHLRYHSPEVARTLVDKRLQRATLHRAGIPGPAFWSVPARITSTTAADLADRITYPAVLKPAKGSGSRDIHPVDTPETLLALLQGANGCGYLVEEYLYDQPEQDHWFASYLSVESVVSAGRISHVALTGRFPLAEPFRETGNFIPAILRPELRPIVLELVDKTIEALGISDSVTHTEIKLTPDGPKVIEINGRLGGRPPFVLRSVSSINLLEVACQVAVGTPVCFEELVACHGVGYWLMLQPPMSAHRVTAVGGLDKVSTLDGVYIVSLNRGPGTTLDWRDGTDSQVVTVRGCVADHDQLARAIANIRRQVSISYDK